MTDEAATPVQRYGERVMESGSTGECYAVFDKDPQGDWVRYADHQAALATARAEAVALREAIEWALGCSGDFVVRKRGEGPFWWRKELRERALAAVPPQPTPGGE